MEKAKKAVIDASVVAKWYVQERFSDKALQLRDDFRSRKIDLVSPRLLFYEVANGLRYSPELSSKDVEEAVGSLVDMQIALVDFDLRQWTDVVRNALSFGISVYDSSYYTTAEIYHLKLLTADRLLFSRIGGRSSISIEHYDHSLL